MYSDDEDFLELIIGIFKLIGVLMLIVGATLVAWGIAYVYWVLSIGVTPICWLLIIISAIIGFVCALRNAAKAIAEIYKKENM